ncbi:MAG: phospholipase D-like domain-containing protein [Bacilli bacterium]
MISVVKTPTYDPFLTLVQNSSKEVLLCAPYIKLDIVKDILRFKNPLTKLEVITSSNIANFVNGSLDIEAIKTLLENGCNVINYQNLHAKIYLFDSIRALITSANLTNNGLYHNYEYGVLIENDEVTTNQIYTDFVAMLDSELSGALDLKSILKIEKLILKLKLKSNSLTKIDYTEDTILPIAENENLSAHFSPWEKDVFNCLNLINKEVFFLIDIYAFSKELSKMHPDNKNIEPKIRQILQHLRDMGFIKFISPGKYKKLWFIIDRD